MTEITKKDMLNFYRSILDPMGFVITIKPVKQEEPWKPKDADKYDQLNTQDLEKQLANLKVQMDNMQKIMREVRDKAVNMIGQRLPNDYTKDIYIANNMVEKNSVIMTCQALDENNRVYQYLDQLRLQKYKEELLEAFQEKQPGVLSMEMVKENLGARQLKISLK